MKYKPSIPHVASPYMKEAVAAAYLQISRRTLQNMRWLGNGPAFLKQGRRVLYRIEDLDEWIQEKAVLKTRTNEVGIRLDAASA